MPIIALMIEACQMENSVQQQYLHLDRRGMTKIRGISAGNFGGNGDLACEGPFSISGGNGVCRERENVCRPVLLSKSQVERTHFGVAGQQDIYISRQPDCALGMKHKAAKRHCAQSLNPVLEDDHCGNLSVAPK